MNNNKLTLGLLFGGKSAEHEVSLQSAKNIAEAIDREKFDLAMIAIDKAGKWFLMGEDYLVNPEDPQNIKLANNGIPVTLIPGEGNASILNITSGKTEGHIDVAFSIIHGTQGEDGALQGFFNILDIPFVGADILGSAIGMDKDVMKRLLRDANLPNADFVCYHISEKGAIDEAKLIERFKLPIYVKPATMGSSVGISKVEKPEQFTAAIDEAFRFDNKIVIEEQIIGREIECAVLGNENPKGSLPGEIVPVDGFYSYKAKYIDSKGAELKIPAELSPELSDKVRETAVQAYKVLCCEGLARVDLFVGENTIYVNEINTLPGFTKISMYPKLWGITGIAYAELIGQLIQLAIDRKNSKDKLLSHYEVL